MTSNDNQATKIVKGIKNSNPIQRNSIESLLNRSIKFRKSRHVDQKLELFKQKFVPVNETTGVVFASTGSSYNTTEEDSISSKVDEHGFESPSKLLYPPDKLNFSWLSILPIGPGLKDLGQLSSLNAVLQVITYTPVLANYFLQRRHSPNCKASLMLCFKTNSLFRYYAGILFYLCSRGACKNSLEWDNLCTSASCVCRQIET